MKDYLKKITSSLALTSYLAGASAYASEPGNKTEKIDINNSFVLFVYEQPPIFRVGKITLECDKPYLINRDTVIEKPHVVLERIGDYLKSQMPFYTTNEGKKRITSKSQEIDSILETEYGYFDPVTNKRIGNREVSNTGLAKFKQAAADGIITTEEYMKLETGDVYVAKRLGYRDLEDQVASIEQGSLSEGVIVEVSHFYDKSWNCPKPKPKVIARLEDMTNELPTEQVEEQPLPHDKGSELKDKIGTYKPSKESKTYVEENLETQTKKKMSKGKKTGIWIGILAGLAAGYALTKDDEEKKCTDPGCISGGDEF